MRTPTSQNAFGMLLVADDPVDVLVMMDVVKKSYVPVCVQVSSTAKALWPEDKPSPDVVVLDLSLKLRDPYDVLTAVKHDASLAGVPTVVLGAPDSEDDIEQSFALGADIYIAKPIDLQRFTILLNWAKEF
jgi:DNA-binding response OmpR family regulator